MSTLGVWVARWRRLDVVVRDLPPALVLAVASFLPGAHGAGTMLGGLPNRPFDALAIVAVLLQSLPLAIRRRYPALSVALVFGGFVIDQLRGYHTLAGVGLAFAVLSSGAMLGRRRWLVGASLTIGYIALSVAIVALGGTESAGDFVGFFLVLAAFWVVGEWWRHTRRIEADRRRLIAESARGEERARIAREMHDVVTHHVTAMVVQADAARYLPPDRVPDTFDSIADTGRRAVADLRSMLGLLDSGRTAPDLDELIARTRAAGQPIRFVANGRRPRNDEAEQVVHRVVQEALTNALKYAHGAGTVVEVHRGDDRTEVRVTTDGTGAAASVGGGGRGIRGIRERVEALGGELSAAADPSGGFRVAATIPARPAPRPSRTDDGNGAEA